MSALLVATRQTCPPGLAPKQASCPIFSWVQILRTALYSKERRTYVVHGGSWYERIRAYFRGEGIESRRRFEMRRLSELCD